MDLKPLMHYFFQGVFNETETKSSLSGAGVRQNRKASCRVFERSSRQNRQDITSVSCLDYLSRQAAHQFLGYIIV